MSSALVQQALEIVDPEFKQTNGKKVKNSNNRHKSSKAKGKHGHNTSEKINLTKKLTIIEAKKKLKSKETILKENLKKLKQIREACLINLDKATTAQIIERGVTKRPIKPKRKHKKAQKTAFTEEDFKKFEEEYMG